MFIFGREGKCRGTCLIRAGRLHAHAPKIAIIKAADAYMENYQSPALSADTGLRSGRVNMDIDRLLLQRHQGGECGDLLRFHRSRPTACLGRHQSLPTQLREDFCRRRGIDIVRRASGGGAIYLDPGQQGMSLLIRRRQPWSAMKAVALLERFGRALGEALKACGIEAVYAFPNDLEIDGRKCASVYLASAGESLLFFATLLLEIDVETALCALRVPTEKLSADGLADARARYAPLAPRLANACAPRNLQAVLAERIGASFGLEFQPADSAVFEDLVARAEDGAPETCPPPDDDGAMGSEAVWRTPGGVLRARVACDAQTGAIARAELEADVQVAPDTLFEQIETAAAGRTPCMIEGAVHRAFSLARAEPVGFSVADVTRVLALALETDAFKRRRGLGDARLMLYDDGSGLHVEMTLASAGAMLVPYCAKPNWCKWRHREGCSECGLCEVGEAYRLGRERGMAVVTVTSYEHLRTTLGALKAAGTQAYVGMCCGHFFVKRHAAFQEAGMPALLMDISGSNCYELGQEGLAYAGKFEANASLDGTLLSQVIHWVPARAAVPGGLRPADESGQTKIRP